MAYWKNAHNYEIPASRGARLLHELSEDELIESGSQRQEEHFPFGGMYVTFPFRSQTYTEICSELFLTVGSVSKLMKAMRSHLSLQHLMWFSGGHQCRCRTPQDWLKKSQRCNPQAFRSISHSRTLHKAYDSIALSPSHLCWPWSYKIRKIYYLVYRCIKNGIIHSCSSIM